MVQSAWILKWVRLSKIFSLIFLMLGLESSYLLLSVGMAAGLSSSPRLQVTVAFGYSHNEVSSEIENASDDQSPESTGQEMSSEIAEESDNESPESEDKQVSTKIAKESDNESVESSEKEEVSSEISKEADDPSIEFEDMEVSYEIPKGNDDQPLVFPQPIDGIVVRCTAKYPIEWIASSQISNKLNTIDAFRSKSNVSKFQTFDHNGDESEDDDDDEEIKNGQIKYKPVKENNGTAHLHIFNPEEFYHHLEINIEPEEGLFGYIGSCQKIHREKTTTGENDEKETPRRLELFIREQNSMAKYFMAAGRVFKILNRQRIKIPQEEDSESDMGFLIPCPLINATMTMTRTTAAGNSKPVDFKLVQIFNEGEKTERLELINSKFNPKVGFYVQEKILQGTFECRLQSNANANSTLIQVEEKVTFQFVQQNQTKYQYHNQDREDWLDITDGAGDSLTTMPMADFPRRKNKDTTARVVIREDLDEVRCINNHDSKADAIQFFRLRCSTHVECDFLRGCFNQKKGFCEEIMSKGVVCSPREQCRKLQGPRVTGLLKCTFGGNIVYAYSFTGLDRNQYYLNTVNDPIPRHSALIQIAIQKYNGETDMWESDSKPSGSLSELELFTNERHVFKCTASKFFFTEELIFLAEYENETWAYFQQESFYLDPGEDSNDIEYQVHLNLTSDMKGVSCRAPWFNSSTWIEAVQPFVAKDVSSPEIKTEQKETIFYIGEKDRILTCSATGEPKPSFTWTRKSENGTELKLPTGETFPFSIRYLTNSTILQFLTITESLQGIYICTATNKFGSAQQSFSVQVKESGLSKAAIVGIVIGIIIVVVAFVLILYKYFQTRKQLRNLTADEIDEFEKGNPEALKNAEVQGENAHLLPFNKEYEIPISNFSIDQNKILGSGEFGVVYGGKLHDLAVAIKTTKSDADVDFFKAFLKEIKVMTFIGKHPNVVQLLGTSTNRIRERVVYVVVELGTHGSLLSFLKDNETNFVDTLSSSQLFNVSPEKIPSNSSGYANVKQITMTTRDFVTWCGQIAAGMSHLASKKIIHGDLAPRNILLFDYYTAKITDFGLSRQLYTSSNYVKKSQSPVPWRLMAPESLKYLEFSTKSDVWAFGVLTWEIFSLAAVPYSAFSWTQKFIDDLEQGMRLEKPKLASNEIYGIMCECWNLQVEQRPDFEQLGHFYNGILERREES